MINTTDILSYICFNVQYSISPLFPYSSQSEAFDLEYLGRVADVKDTVHKAPLMLHLVELVVEKFPESSDLYADLPHIHRVAKVSE